MTDIEQKALALVNEVKEENSLSSDYYIGVEALCRAIEQHEAFKQKVSDAVEAFVYANADDAPTWEKLMGLLIPAPKPDPLVHVLLDMDLSSDLKEGQHDAKWLRIKLDALGFEIREKNDG